MTRNAQKIKTDNLESKDISVKGFVKFLGRLSVIGPCVEFFLFFSDISIYIPSIRVVLCIHLRPMCQDVLSAPKELQLQTNRLKARNLKAMDFRHQKARYSKSRVGDSARLNVSFIRRQLISFVYVLISLLAERSQRYDSSEQVKSNQNSPIFVFNKSLCNY